MIAPNRGDNLFVAQATQLATIPSFHASPAMTSAGMASAHMGIPASLRILAEAMALPGTQEGMLSHCPLRLAASPLAVRDHTDQPASPVPCARQHYALQQEVQGPLASNEGLINPGLEEPAQLLDGSDALQEELDEQQLEPGPHTGHQATGQQQFINIPCRPPDPASMQPAVGLHLIQQAISMLEGVSPPLPDMIDEDWLAYVHKFVLPLQHFRAGFISTRLAVWQCYFKHFGLTAKAKQILQWLQHGLDIHWVPYDAASQHKHPKYHKRLQLIRELLRKTVGAHRVEAALHGNMPQQVHFSNRVSLGMYEEFVDSAIQDLLKTGAICPWTEPQQITVISGMGVAVDRKGKKRLILDARYINLFDKYEGFSYESLSDVPQYLQPGDFIMLTDLKAGYHQVKMHPNTYRFLGIQYKGHVYYFAHLPFGLSSACKAYTVLMGEVYRPLRMKGQRMSFLIDDAFFAWLSKPEAKRQGMIVLMVLSALGFFLSIPKCQLLALPTGQFLGLIINAPQSKFEIPTEKKEYILQLIEEGLQKNGLTSRHLAKIAGVLLSVKEAVHMAPLYTRLLFRAVAAAQGWDVHVPDEAWQFAKDDLLHWKRYLLQQPGKSWARRQNVHHVTGDVSGIGYAGYSDLLPAPVVLSYNTDEWAALSADPHSLSSVHRETRNAQLTLQTVILQRASQVQGALLVYFGDNQGSISCLRKMRGLGSTLAVVRELYAVAAAHDVALEFIWKPRTTAEIQLADELSRTIDTSDFALNNTLFVRLCKQWGFPTADVFAGQSRRFHKHKKFFTSHFTPDTAGVDAMLQDWACLKDSQGRLQLWVFPPFQLVGQVIQKLLKHRSNAILLLPAWVCYWTTTLSSLPIQDEYCLPYHRGMYILGSRLPPSMQQSGCPYSLKECLKGSRYLCTIAGGSDLGSSPSLVS